MRLDYCTFTGVDEQTSLKDIEDISSVFVAAEWGFLWSHAGKENPRYPSFEFITTALTDLPSNVNCSLHFCGRSVENLLKGEVTETILLNLMSKRRGRVQLNFSEVDLGALREILDKFPNIGFITQHNTLTENLWHHFAGLNNYSILFDEGVPQKSWPKPFPEVYCGYAGGINPDNIEQNLEQITETIGNQNFWIDIETGVRNPETNLLDLSACQKCLELSQSYS